MFGQGNPSPFGSPPGQPGGGFGSTNTAPGFGSPSAAPFGTSTPFGAGGGAFGSPPAQQPSGFGTTSAFGSSAPTGFGTGTTFGAPSPSVFGSTGGGFGASATQPSPFGAAAPAPGTTGGLFGAPTPSTGGSLFGGGGTGAFGASTAPSAFGGGGLGGTPGFGTSTTPTFGAPAPSLFGSPAPPATAFGGTTFGASAPPAAFGAPAPSTTGLFGAPAPAGGGLFGSSAPGGGTKVSPYQVTTRQDGTSSMALQAITAMQPYEQKSFEELRFEDYLQGNKGTGAAPTGGGFGFGSQSTPGLFGMPSPAPAPFGAAPAPGAFGAPAPTTTPSFGLGSTTGTFGSPAPAPFGAPTTFGAPSPGLFGAPAPTQTFGSAPAPKPGGLFGTPPAPAPGLFGAPAPAPTSLFGASPGLFGATPAPSPGGLFGSTPAFGSPAPAPSLFGAPAPAPTAGLFGAPAPASGLFGAPAPAPTVGLFGAPAPAGGLFGVPAPAPTSGLFGAPPPGGGLFGSPPPAPVGGIFGGIAPAPAGTGLFGAPTPASVAPPANLFASPPINIVGPLANEVLAQQVAALENQRRELEKLDEWRKRSPETSSVFPTSLSEAEAGTTIHPYRGGYGTPYRAPPESSARIRPRGFNRTPAATNGAKAFRGVSLSSTDDHRPFMSPTNLVASSVKNLMMKPGALTPKPKKVLQWEAPTESRRVVNKEPEREELEEAASKSPGLLPAEAAATEPSTPAPPRVASPGYDYYQRVVAPPDTFDNGSSEFPKPMAPPKQDILPKLTKSGYKVSPSLEALSLLSEGDLAAVPRFSISREGIGSIRWEGAVDLRGVDLDRAISIEVGDVSVYMEEEENGTKPEEGTKLNRPAVISLLQIFPKEGDDKDAFARRIAKVTQKLGAKLISYDGVTGEWVFRVEHFSRYCLVDDDSDEESGNIEPTAGFKSAAIASGDGRAEVVPVTRSLVYEEDENYQLAPYVSDADMTDTEERVQRDRAENAYERFAGMMEESVASMEEDEDEAEQSFFAENIQPPEIKLRNEYGVYFDERVGFDCDSGICSRIMAQVNVGAKVPSTDATLRFGKSFRVCWSPNGSFFRPGSKPNGLSPTLIQCRPVFSNDDFDSKLSTNLLDSHLSHSILSITSEGFPLFNLPTGVANAGTTSSQKALSNAVRSFAAGCRLSTQSDRDRDPEVKLIPFRAFDLLSCFDSAAIVDSELGAIGEDEPSGGTDAVSKWVVDACAHDVQVNVTDASRRRDNPAAVFAAVAGGDLKQASDLAFEMGHVNLALLLSAGTSSCEDIRNQIASWCKSGVTSVFPEDTLRVFELLGGDLEGEKNNFKQGASSLDWRRHFALRMFFGRNGGEGLSDLIHQFTTDVNNGAAAYPVPRYLRKGYIQGGRAQPCTLYRLLQLLENPSQCLISNLVEPLGYSPFVHNVAVSFHLAAVLSAMGVCSPLSPMEEAHLVDSYAAQLISKGSWEWAVFVLLFRFQSKASFDSRLRYLLAKKLIIQNYQPADPFSQAKQDFLEKRIRVPHTWFEEAAALRCAADGDVAGYLLHTLSFSPSTASQILERVLVPNLYFMSRNDIESGLTLLANCDSHDSPLAVAMYDFFQLEKVIRRIRSVDCENLGEELQSLAERCRAIEETFMLYKSKAKVMNLKPLIVYPDYPVVPMEAFLSEAISALTSLSLDLRAMEVGLPARLATCRAIIPTLPPIHTDETLLSTMAKNILLRNVVRMG